jgi:mannose-6-phosphate isomerase-like protein (cupin superfamily)
MPLTLTNTTSNPNTGNMQFSYDHTANKATQNVAMVYPTEASSYRITQIIIPPRSKFHVGAHWHEDYTEIMRVVKGRVKILLGKTWKVYTAADGEVIIPKNVIHDFMRADVDAQLGEEDQGDLVLEETGDPGMELNPPELDPLPVRQTDSMN